MTFRIIIATDSLVESGILRPTHFRLAHKALSLIYLERPLKRE